MTDGNEIAIPHENITGAALAKEFGIECKQALYSQDGNWYAAITDFPCVLFDANGFVIVTSTDNLHALGIVVGKHTNVRKRITSLPTYQLLSTWRVSLPEELRQDTVGRTHFEGAAVTITVNRYERDRTARTRCIAHYGCVCHACGIKLADVYGAAANNFIHVHHVTPIASIKTEYELDPIRDLRPLCPNCHAVVHLRHDPYSIEELQTMLKERGNG